MPTLREITSRWRNPKSSGHEWENVSKGHSLETRPSGQPTAEQPVPFMAMANDKYGLPYYGDGIKGWARKTFAKIFDPDKLLPSPSEQQLEYLEQAGEATDISVNVLGQELSWNDWVGKWTGIKASDAATAAAAGGMAIKGKTEEGEVNPSVDIGETIKTSTGVAIRGSWQALWTGLEALGLLDKASRRYQAFGQALDELGESSTILPDLTSEEIVKKYEGTPYESVVSTLMDLANLNPGFMAVNALRAITSGKSIEESFKTIKDYQRASNMMYTMYWDEAKKQEYFRRIQAGEDPGLLQRELENPWVELAGSFFGDPATYIGAGVIGKMGSGKAVKLFGKIRLPWDEVGRIPGFTEILGLKNIGRAKITSGGDLFTKFDTPKLEKLVAELEDIKDEAEAAQTVRNFANGARNFARRFSGVIKGENLTDDILAAKKFIGNEYGIFSKTSGSKAEMMKQTVGTTFGAMMSSKSKEDIVEAFQAWRQLKSSNDAVVLKATAKLKEFGSLPFSRAGAQTFEFMAKLEDDIDIAKIVKQYGDDTVGLVDDLAKKLYRVVDDMYPAINDMEKAVKAVKEGAELTGRNKFLVESYDMIKKTKPSILWANSMNNKIAGNKIYIGLQSFFSNAFLGSSYGYSLRNLQTDSALVWHDIGALAAAENVATGFPSAFSQKVADIAHDARVEKIKSMLGGQVPFTTSKGVGKAGVKGGWFGHLAAQRVERNSSSLIVKLTVETEMINGIRHGGMPSADFLPKELQELLFSTTMGKYGDAPLTEKAFKEAIATGFYDAWRHKEIDPLLEGAMRGVNKYDELLEIRATSTDAEFASRMDDFIKSFEDVAANVNKDPALVSSENAMSEVSVLFDKVMNDGENVFNSTLEANAFRALTESRSQLRGLHQTVIDDMVGKLGTLVGDPVRIKFEDAIAKQKQILNKGGSSLRDLVTGLYESVYKKSKYNKAPPAELWNKAAGVVVDMSGEVPGLRTVSLAEMFPDVDPAVITNNEFNGYFWSWIKQTQTKYWDIYTKAQILGSEKILAEYAQEAGVVLDELVPVVFEGVERQRLLARVSELTDLTSQWEEYMGIPQKIEKMSGGKAYERVEELLAGKVKGAVQEWSVLNRKGEMPNAEYLKKVRALYKDDAEILKAVDELGFDKLSSKIAPPPPYVEGTRPTKAREIYENLKGGLKDELIKFKTQTLNSWGERTPITDLAPAQEEELSKWMKELGRRTVDNRARAMAVADTKRNFILHDYNKTYTDLAAQYLLMYHYWPSRTYAKTLERAVDTPGMLAAYMKYRKTMEKVHADQPEWYRYNIPIGKLPGMDNSPLYFNLEQTINPINGLTGVDFNDPKKRVDWMSSAVDDMGKMGFNVAVPLQWLMAMNLYRKGEDDAGRRWAGRAVPQSRTLKAALNLMNVKLPDVSFAPGVKYGELDPFVNLLGDGTDPYEEPRVGRAMAALMKEGKTTPEEAYDAMYNKTGDLYDLAVYRATNERAPSQIASFFLGVGWKGRSEGDLQVDKFYAEWFKLLSMRENISPDDYKAAFDQLKDQYPFADTVLLAKRGGDERDAAYAYNVLSRLPPNDLYPMMEEAGVDRNTIERFYNDKGDFGEWKKQDRDRFMSAILDFGVMFKMPDAATKQGWNDAKKAYGAVYDQIEEQFGADIWDRVEIYYDMLDVDKDLAYTYKDSDPQIQMALTAKQQATINDPIIFEYYGSMETVEAYWDGWVRNELAKRFGNTSELWNEYYQIKLAVDAGMMEKGEINKFKKAHKELFGAYQDEKARLQAIADKEFINMAAKLPEQPPLEFREGFEPQSGIQQGIAEAGRPSGVPSWDEIETMLNSAALSSMVQEHFKNGTELTYNAQNQLDYVAGLYGMSGSDLLRIAGASLQR